MLLLKGTASNAPDVCCIWEYRPQIVLFHEKLEIQPDLKMLARVLALGSFAHRSLLSFLLLFWLCILGVWPLQAPVAV